MSATQTNLFACSCGWTSNPNDPKDTQADRAIRHKPVRGAKQCLVRWWNTTRLVRDTDHPDTPDYPMSPETGTGDDYTDSDATHAPDGTTVIPFGGPNGGESLARVRAHLTGYHFAKETLTDRELELLGYAEALLNVLDTEDPSGYRH